MPRVIHVQKAAKDYPDKGIKKGEAYYWWKFRYGPKMFSKTPPRQSQLTQSEFLGSMYDIEERIQDLNAAAGFEAIESERDSIAEELRELAESQDEKLNNMPESLQQGSTGELLDERRQNAEEMADSLEGVELDSEMDQEDMESAVDEMRQVSYNGS